MARSSSPCDGDEQADRLTRGDGKTDTVSIVIQLSMVEKSIPARPPKRRSRWPLCRQTASGPHRAPFGPLIRQMRRLVVPPRQRVRRHARTLKPPSRIQCLSFKDRCVHDGSVAPSSSEQPKHDDGPLTHGHGETIRLVRWNRSASDFRRDCRGVAQHNLPSNEQRDPMHMIRYEGLPSRGWVEVRTFQVSRSGVSALSRVGYGGTSDSGTNCSAQLGLHTVANCDDQCVGHTGHEEHTCRDLSTREAKDFPYPTATVCAACMSAVTTSGQVFIRSSMRR